MSSEKNSEVVGCNASIMKNVWEIREREYMQKLQLEQERIEKSALPSINKDWQNRSDARLGTHKRVERKKKPVEDQTDSNNVWRSKKPQVPPTSLRRTGSGPLGRPGGQKGGFSTSTPNYKDKKGQDKNLKRLQLLMFITQTQPSAMVWGKSWKYNKSLPLPAEGAEVRSDWGRCWMFASQQPYSEAGKPWPNGPNEMDPLSLHLWKKPDCREVESQQLDLSLPTEEWQMSWRKPYKNNKGDTSSVNGENGPKFGFFTLLVETQHHNEALCSSEWNESWRSTKPTSQQDHFNVSNDCLMNEQHKDREMSSTLKECWKLINHHGYNKSKVPQVQNSHSPEWANSWKVAKNHNNSDPSLSQEHRDNYDNHGQQKESPLYNVKLVFHEQKCRDLYLQLCNEFKDLSEWSKSWQVTKNNSKPCEEIEKVLKAALETQKVEEKTKGYYSASEKADPSFDQLKYSEIYQPNRVSTQSMMRHLKHLENVWSPSEWRNSWRTLKHRMRMERRRMRPDPSRPFRTSEEEGNMKPIASEWKDSWKFTCRPLHQEPEFWQAGWSTMPQIRVDRARDQNHFAPVELPKNGPTGDRSWGESWRFTRPQHQSGSGQGRVQTSQGRSSVASHCAEDSQVCRRYIRSVSDWQEAWMVSETQFHHDKPSLTQWRGAWKCSNFQAEHWSEQVPREKRVGALMETQREMISLQRDKDKMSSSFDNQMFREKYPEKQWSASWRAASVLNLQDRKSMSSTNQQQHATPNGHGSKWGMSFRLANPMPHMEQFWVESPPNRYHYKVMWSRQKNINTKFSNNPVSFRLWGTSHQFLQGARAQINDKTKSKAPVDPRVIITKKTKTRRHLYSNIEKEKQSNRKWAGCHLLGKTQPRPKRGPASMKKSKMEDKTEDKFFEEWAESWTVFVLHGSLKKQMPVKSLSGWDVSWKFLLPPYQPMNSPKTV
ncbi:hypothetical protein L3Q82_012259 [Scortum barcoo]|uniref:Uncharacterized protein n=1 Tax=Scortum barcoo TaxID=214431 RepID=A0ACB8W5R6_9TELE|nr:hypothetical protein L3Q82_012259 [Scortum barcoo]